MAKIVILIEDEKSLRSMYADLLRDEGYEVTEVSEGEKGLETVTNENWDLLLLDIMLPKMDGVEILKKIQEIAKIKDRPIVVLTNLANEEIKNKCLELGAKEYLLKSDILPNEVLLSVKKYVFND